MWTVDECEDANGNLTIRPSDGSRNGNTERQPIATVYGSAPSANLMAAAPAMLAALQALVAVWHENNGTDPLGLEPELPRNQLIADAQAAISLATGTPTGETEPVATAGGIEPAGSPCDFTTHSGIITAAQGYVSDPDHWNPPNPAQVAHLLRLSGISHGPIASEEEG